jgi:Protein of unknown function (DUF3106)
VRHVATVRGLCLALLMGLAAQPASAQFGQRWRANQQRKVAAQQERANRGPNGGAKGQPNAHAMEGLPPKWVENLRDMPPDEQQRFMENNDQFQRLRPERQDQIRRNLQRWNSLSAEQKQRARNAEAALERMTPEQRQYVRNVLLPKWQTMPVERRQVLNRRLAMLRDMSPATQESALNDPRFMQGLSPDEQSMLRDLNSLRNTPTQ